MKSSNSSINPNNQHPSPAAVIAAGLRCGDPECTCAGEKENGWRCHCPSHSDETPSLSVSEGEDGKVLVHCFAGCSQSEVIKALQAKGLWPCANNGKPKIVATYDYVNEAGQLLFQACRFEPKDFRQRRPDGKSGWEYKVKGTRLLPYRLPEVIKADQVFINEGEKDCDNLAKVGLTATCNPMGAGKWRPEYNDYFRGKKVFILPDNDDPGRQHAQNVAGQLHGIAASVKVLELPGLLEKGDVSDWLAAGNTAQDLLALVVAAPEWSPPVKESAPSRRRAKGSDKSSPQLTQSADHQIDSELPPVKEALPDAPVPDEVLIPDGWTLSHEGLWLKSKKNDGSEPFPVAPAPILIAGRLVSVSDGKEHVILTWLRDGKWRQCTVERAMIAGRSITELANLGLPVTSVNATNVIKYLSSFEAINLAAIPRAQVSRQMGWQGDDGNLGFLWGRVLLHPDLGQDQALDLEAMPPEMWQRGMVTFRGSDQGDEQIAEAYSSRGSFDEWLTAVCRVRDFPRALIALYGALTPPLLSILNCANFIMDWCNSTSTGKTSVLRLGASCWGNPDERAPASVLLTWDSTWVFINRVSALLNSLPLILDDTKRAKRPADIAKTLYDVSSGRDRGRGSIKGLRRSGSWHTVLLSSGEVPAVSFTQAGGTRARVLTLWGPPFGRADDTTAPLVHQLNQTVLNNYGHAGPRFVKFLLSRRAEWPKWREQYHRVQAAYLQQAGNNPVVGRQCAYFASLDMAAGIAHAALDLPWAYRDPVEALWNDLTSGSVEADVAARALVALMSWARGNQVSFFGRHGDRVPLQGYAGKWDLGSSWEYIAFLPHRLNDLLSSFGFEPEAVIRAWNDRGWLATDGGNRRQKRVRLDNERPWTIAIRREAIEELEEE